MHAEIIKRLEKEFGLKFKPMPGGKKYRAYFEDGSFVEVHAIFKKEGRYSIYYQKPDGRYMRWDNALNGEFPWMPHHHEGRISAGKPADAVKVEDKTLGDVNKIIQRLRKEHGR